MSYLLSRRSVLATALACCARTHAAEEPFISGPVRDWRSLVHNKELVPAFEYLSKADLQGMSSGRHEIDGDRMYITLSEAETHPLAGAMFEAHRKYADIHILISGHEVIGAAPAAGLKVAKPYDRAKEVEMYEQPASFRRIRLKPGEFALFLPGQAHLPGCHEDTATKIRKAVVKVLMS